MRTISTLGFLLCMVMASGAQAANDSDLSEIRRFAEMKCGTCHVVEKPKWELTAYSSAGVPPSFHTLAHDPAMTPQKLRRALRLPTGNMATLMLTDQDIESLVAYIVSLRTP